MVGIAPRGEGGSIVETDFRSHRPRLWLIVGREGEKSRVGPLTLELSGGTGRALAVFSFEEEARMHLLLVAPIGRWHVEETRPEELASLLLSGPCSGAERVVLDLLGETWAREANCLLSTSRESFLLRLLALGPEAVSGSTSNG